MKADFEKWWTHNGNGPYRGTDLEYHEGRNNQFAEDYAKQEKKKEAIKFGKWIEKRAGYPESDIIYIEALYQKLKDDGPSGS